MNSILLLILGALLMIAGITLGVTGIVLSCGGLLTLGVLHALGSLTILGRSQSQRTVTGWLGSVAIGVWFASSAIAALTLIKTLPMTPDQMPHALWATVLLVIAGVWFAIAQIAGIGATVGQHNRWCCPVLYELTAFSLIGSIVLRFDHEGFPLASVSDVFLRVWTVTFALDGVARVVIAFLDGTLAFSALGRAGGIRSYLFGLDERAESDPSTPVNSASPIARHRTGLRSVAVVSVALLMGAAWLLTGLVVVRTHERAVCFHLGRLETKPLEPGLHFRLPYPLARVQCIPVRHLQTRTIGFEASPSDLKSLRLLWTAAHGQREAPFLIGDGTELVAINGLVTYRVSDQPDLLGKYVTSTVDPEELLKSAAQRVLTSETRSATLDNLLEKDLEAWSLQLAERLQGELQRFVPGLEVTSFRILSIHPPIEVAAAFLDQVSARVDAEKNRAEASGASVAELLRCEMMGSTFVADAKGAASRRLTAVVDETAHLAVLAKLDEAHPDIVRRRAYCEALIEALEHKSITVIDARLPPELRLSFGDNSRTTRAGLEGP